MIAISSLLSSTAAMPPPVSAGAATPSLASFLDLLAPVTADLMPGKRQADAVPGKTLPVEDDAANESEDALAWLGVAPSPAMAMIAPAELTVPGADGSGAQATGSIAPAAGMMRGGLMPLSPVKPLVAPPAVSLPGSDGVASIIPGARTPFGSAAGEVSASLPSSTAHVMQRAPVPANGHISKYAASPERSVSRIGDRPFSPEPFAAPSGTSESETNAKTTPTAISDGVASMAPGTRTPPVPASDGAGTALPSSGAFNVQHAPASRVRDVADNATVLQRPGGRTNMPLPNAATDMIAVDDSVGAPLGDAGVKDRCGEQPSAHELLAASVGASTIAGDATPVPGRWSALGSSSAPTLGVTAALTSQALIVPHRFAQMSGAQPRVGTEPPNTPAMMPIAVALPGITGVAVAKPVSATSTGEALSAPAQVSANGSPARPAGDASVSDIGQPALRPAAPAPIGTPVVVDDRLFVAAPIVQAGTGPRPGFLPASILPTGTSVEPPAPGAAAPAAMVFADAIHLALGERDSRGAPDPAAALAPVAPTLPGVTATGTAAHGTLDMRAEHWPAAMIERIVTLRDMAAENDTRLRLSPDMLGTIDVSLRRDGDQVQVQISAEQAQTRQLLAEAQPRLAELADARGVKLQLSGGQAGGGDRPGGDAPRHHPSTPVPTRRQTAAHDDAGSTDQRIA